MKIHSKDVALITAYVDGSMSEQQYVELLYALRTDPELMDALLQNLEVRRDIEFVLNEDTERNQRAGERICYVLRTAADGEKFLKEITRRWATGDLGQGVASATGGPGRRIAGRHGEPAFPAELHLSHFRRPPARRGRHIFRVFVSRLLPLCAAATVLVAVWHFGVSSSDQEGEAFVGKLVEASGRTACISSRAELERIGAAVKALPEDTPADERDGLWSRWYGKTGSKFEVLRTGPDGRIRFRCADGSMVSVEGGSNVAITKPERNLPGDVQVWIESGAVSADVSKHEGQSQLVFRTPHAKAVIVGTRLELGVGPQSTRLAVHEGLVEFHRLSDGSMILVGAGEYAVCSAGTETELVAKSMQPAPVETRAPEAQIWITADNAYELYVNGVRLGTGNDWQSAQTWGVALQAGKNVIAVKGIDAGGVAGLLAEVRVGSQRIGTSAGWKVCTSEEAGWTGVSFDDRHWAHATEHGMLGAAPWSQSISGMPADTPARWIWSLDFENDDTAFFRRVYTVGTAPSAMATEEGARVGISGKKEAR